MSLKATLQHTLGMSNMIMERYLSDLDPAAFFERPVAGMNHLAWQVGHIISVERRFMEEIKPGSSPELPASFDAQHAKERHTSDEPGDFLTKDEYLSLWKAQRAATTELLETMTDADLEAPASSEKTRQMCPTVATVFSLAGMHSILHAGQFVAVRRHAALPIAF